MKVDVVIIGGGAAGLFCAIEAGKRGRKVMVIERNATVGRKIIISGGGRCNFTNLYTTPENFVSRNPHFCKSALARYTPEDFIALVKKNRIEFYEKKLGQLFCRERSQQIVDMLLRECEKNAVKVRTGCEVTRIERDDAFRLSTTIGEVRCASLVIATGGLSFPKIGATDFGYGVARQFGLRIERTSPSLVALIFRNGMSSKKLAGVSADSIVTSGGSSFRENILFTHRGLSGPAILQISNYWDPVQEVTIDLLPTIELSDILESHAQSRQQLATVLAKFLPERLVTALCPPEIASKPVSQLSKTDLVEIERMFKSWRVLFGGTEGYDKAEVTLGGVSTNELSSQTMEVRSVPGLFFIGEVVDVTGWLGGFNFQWAWASGFAAGAAV